MPVEQLDHGYVQLVETWGSDERIIEAARMSTGKGFLGWGGGKIWKCSRCGYYCDEAHVPRLRELGLHSDTGAVTRRNLGIAYCPNSECFDETLVE